MPLSPLETELSDQIGRRGGEMLRDLAEHVAIPTGHNHTVGLDRYRDLLADRLSALGAVVRHVPGEARPTWLTPPGASGDADDSSAGEGAIPPCLVAQKHVSDDAPRVLIVGHIDTVHPPAGPFRELTINEQSGLATGPGVVDMKGGVVIAINALEVLTAGGVELNWTVLLNSDEETGSFHSEIALQDAAKEHDLGIVVEPALADGSLAVERMGAGQFRIEVFGKSSHVGREFTEGISAVTKLAELLLQLADLARPDDGMIVNVGPLQGGPVTNAVPDYASAWGNVRYRGEVQGRQLARAIDALATSGDELPRVVVHRHWNRPAKPKIPATMAFAAEARRAAEDLGQSLPFDSTGGVCDGNILQSMGLPTLDTLGVRGGHLHRPDEFVELSSLIERCQLLTTLLVRIATGGSQFMAQSP